MSSIFSPPLLRVPVQPPMTLVTPGLAVWKAATFAAMTRKLPGVIVLPAGKAKVIPLLTVQPVRSTVVVPRLWSSIHSRVVSSGNPPPGR